MKTFDSYVRSLIRNRLPNFKLNTALILLFLLSIIKTVTAGEVILPSSGMRGPNATKDQTRAADASSNLMTAISFLQAWGLTDEAANVQKWFESGWIEMDYTATGAATSTTSGVISLGGLLLLGGGKEASNLDHQFDPANKRDKELIAELAFTLVHEKVHAHQSYWSFVGWGARESNETEAYNKEIKQADETLEKMEKELNIAINKGDRVREKEMFEWIQAVLEVKINAIQSFKKNYPDSCKRNWPDRILEDLKKLQEINRDKLKRFNIASTDPDAANKEFSSLLYELKTFEESLPAKQMPAYWMNLHKNTFSYVETKTEQNLGMITFNTLQGQVIVSMPANVAAGDTISGSLSTLASDAPNAKQATNRNELTGYVVEVNEQRAKMYDKKFMYVVSETDVQNGLVVSLTNDAGNMIGSAIAPCSKTQQVAVHPSILSANNFHIPAVGLQGDQISITGPFDGNSANTTCKIGENYLDVIAETPNQMIIFSPLDSKGLTSFTLVEKNIEKKSEYRNLGLQLSASKTTLVKGDQSILTLQLSGLENLKENVILHLVCTGAATMKGGNKQTIEIRPKDVQADGSCLKTRTLTGIEKGTFQVKVTVDNKEQ